MGFVVQPQIRRTSEIPFHSDLAPGDRFVFVGRVIDPICRLYVVGRRVEHVPADQPEWLEDHAHNCPTSYLLIGRNPDLTGLSAEVVIEGRAFRAESPSAILLPEGSLHHHRLVAGSGWSFHVNVRPDYEESLIMDDRHEPLLAAPEVAVEQLYRTAQASSLEALGWETADGGRASGGEDGPVVWKLVDPNEFRDPGVRVHAQQFIFPNSSGWTEGRHRHAGDEVNILLPGSPESFALDASSGDEHALVRAPVSLYHLPGRPHGYTHVRGTGLVLKIQRL
jgi:hypothetical protein